MRVENLQALQKQRQPPRPRDQPARDGGSQGDLVEFVGAIGEEPFDFSRLDAAQASEVVSRRHRWLRTEGLFRFYLPSGEKTLPDPPRILTRNSCGEL